MMTRAAPRPSRCGRSWARPYRWQNDVDDVYVEPADPPSPPMPSLGGSKRRSYSLNSLLATPRLDVEKQSAGH